MISGRYQGFYKLLTADGSDVYDFGVPYDANTCGNPSSLSNCAFFQVLKQLDTFVIANPLQSITAQEAASSRAGSAASGCESGCIPRQLFLISIMRTSRCSSQR